MCRIINARKENYYYTAHAYAVHKYNIFVIITISVGRRVSIADCNHDIGEKLQLYYYFELKEGRRRSSCFTFNEENESHSHIIANALPLDSAATE